MAGTFRAPKGVYDVVPPDSAAWEVVREGLLAPARRAGYAFLETPIFEDTAVFERGVGESTDVVTKEMYTFVDKGGRSMTLRPEGTAGAVRAVVEHGLDRGQLPVKLRYTGPMFRYERPQAGRYRQFQQVGVEALGVDDPALDAEVVTLAVRALHEVGLTRVRLLLNSMGDPRCRPGYVDTLRDWLRGHGDALDTDTRQRIELNPLRVLDDKRPEIAALTATAPLLIDHLCPECKAHYDEVRGHLTDLGVTWHEDPRLVRGLDYYRGTTFELHHEGLGAQSAVGGGGRYDGLAESLGGPPLPGIGWALGMERILLGLESEGVPVPVPPACEVFVVPIGGDARRAAVRLVEELRRRRVAADMAYGGRGLKGAMRAADRSGAVVSVVLGERDLAAGTAQVKQMDSGEQASVALDDVVDEAARRAEERRA